MYVLSEEQTLQVLVETESPKLLEICHSDEHVDCTAPCQSFVDELRAGEFTRVLSEKPVEVCERHNWCAAEEKKTLEMGLPTQKQEMVDYLNRVQHNWRAGIYKGWTSQSRHDFRKLLGTIVDPDVRCKILHKAEEPHQDWVAPDNFDSETNWPQCAKVIGDIRDQSNCGCCWAFGAAEAASDRLCINTNATIMVPLSSQQMCFCAKFAGNGCNGGQVGASWSFIERTGLVTGGQVDNTGPFGNEGMCSSFSMPHCHHHGPQGDDPYPAEGEPGCPSQRSASCPRRCDSDAKAPHDDFNDDKYSFSGRVTSYSTERSIQKALMADGPIETAFSVYEDFANYVSGIYTHTTGGFEGGHAVRIVGWGEENGVAYWKVANSWNPYWGEKGYFRIARGADECGIESGGSASSTGASWSKM